MTDPRPPLSLHAPREALTSGYTYEDLAHEAIKAGSYEVAALYATLALNTTLEEIRDLLREHDAEHHD